MNRQFSLWGFFRTYVFYSVVSWLVFLGTSGGWAALFPCLYGGVFFLGTIGLVLLFTIACQLEGWKSIFISEKQLRIVLCIQLLAILFNPGDNGDGPGGSYPFFERLWSNDRTHPPLLGPLAPYLTHFFYVTYAVALLVLLASVFRRRKGNSTLP